MHWKYINVHLIAKVEGSSPPLSYGVPGQKVNSLNHSATNHVWLVWLAENVYYATWGRIKTGEEYVMLPERRDLIILTAFA